MGVKKPKSNMPAAVLCGYPSEEQERKESQSQQRVYCVPACTVCNEENQHEHNNHDDDPTAAEAFATTAAAAARSTTGVFEGMKII